MQSTPQAAAAASEPSAGFGAITIQLEPLDGLNHAAAEGGVWISALRMPVADGGVTVFSDCKPARTREDYQGKTVPVPQVAAVQLNLESGRWIIGHELTPDQACELAIALYRAASTSRQWASDSAAAAAVEAQAAALELLTERFEEAVREQAAAELRREREAA